MLTKEDKEVARRLGVSEAALAASLKTPPKKRDRMVAALTPSQLSMARQLQISPRAVAEGLKRQNPKAFAAQLDKVPASAPPAPGKGIKSGDKVKIEGDSDKTNARGTISFEPSSDDGFLQDGDRVTIDPGNAAGPVKGQIFRNDDDDSEGGPVQDGDSVFVDTILNCSGIITKLSSASSASTSKAKKAAEVRKAKVEPAAKKPAAVGSLSTLPQAHPTWASRVTGEVLAPAKGRGTA